MTSPEENRNLMIKAQEALAQGKLEEAEEICRQAMKGQPLDAGDLVLLGQILLAKGDGRGAEEALRGALRKEGNHGPATLVLAGVLSGTGRSDEAVVLLRSLLKKDSEQSLPLRFLGDTLCRMAQSEEDEEKRVNLLIEGEAALRKALGLSGWDGTTVTTLAAVLVAQGRKDQALAALEEALKHLEESPRESLVILGDLLLYQVMWCHFDELERTGARLGKVGDGDQVALEAVSIRLAGEAKKMAQAGPEWKERALRLADILEGLAE